MSMGWRIIWRGTNPFVGEQVLDEKYPGNLNSRYNGGEREDYNPCPGVVYSRIVRHAGHDWAGDHHSAEVWV